MAKKQNIKEAVTVKAVADLKVDLSKAREDLFNLQLDQKMRKLKNTRSLFLKRKEIAKILTAMNLQKKEVANG